MKKVTAEQFDQVWFAAKKQNRDIRWVAEQLGITRQATEARAARMRARGRFLPPLLGAVASEEARADAQWERNQA